MGPDKGRGLGSVYECCGKFAGLVDAKLDRCNSQ